MAKKNLLLGMLVVVLAFGMTAVGCDDGSTDGFTGDTALNGTWVDGRSYYKLENGSFERGRDNSPLAKGTYTTSGSQITLSPTHIHGSYIGLESIWYSKDEFETALPGDAHIDIFLPITGTYSIKGNTFTLTFFGEGPQVYTKE